MPIRVDPEGNETRALFSLADLRDKHVLEIGSGDGRLTWRFAGKAAHVITVEPYAPSVAKAKQNVPNELMDRIEFRHAGFEEYALTAQPSTFDVVILSWALC